MKLRRIVSCLMALLLVCSLPVSVLADTWYLEDGSITVNATKSSQTVTQGSTSKDDDAPVITQHDSETTTKNTITINAAQNATAQVTLDGVNINTNSAAIQTRGAGNVTIELDGENTVQSGFDYAGVDKNNTGALVITNTDEVTEEDPGSLTATGGIWGAGIGGGYDEPDVSNITITGNAVVTATGGQWGAGIGGGHGGAHKGSDMGDGENITIEENAHVTASSQGFGAGIGGGMWGDGRDITISGNAYVEAVSGRVGAGIGGGYCGDGSNITISDNAQVKAQGGEIFVWTEKDFYGAGAAIGDGGEQYNPETGAEATIDTSGLEEGWIAKYKNDPQTPWPEIPDPDLEDKEVTSVIYRDENGQLHTATENIVEIDAADPTCTEAGHEAGFQIGDKIVAVTTEATGHSMGAPYTTKEPTCAEEGVARSDCADCDYYETSPIEKLKHTMGEPYTYKEPTCTEEGVARRDCANCDYYETEPIGIVDHSYGDYTSDGNATCTADGTKTRNCIWCDLPDTVPDPGTALGHSFTNYVSDGNATYTEDGTKTAQCDHEGCVETDTVTDAGSRLPYYLVKGQDGRILPSQEERQDGVLTITVEADFAILTGTLGGMRALKGQGIDTIVFVTNGASSTFTIEDLLAQGSAGSTYMLTHDGEAVTFTLGDGTDIGEILK